MHQNQEHTSYMQQHEQTSSSSLIKNRSILAILLLPTDNLLRHHDKHEPSSAYDIAVNNAIIAFKSEGKNQSRTCNTCGNADKNKYPCSNHSPNTNQGSIQSDSFHGQAGLRYQIFS